MHHNPPIRYRPSILEENPALFVWLLLLCGYLALVVIAKYAWLLYDRQIVEFTLWLLLAIVGLFLAVYQITRAKKAEEDAWPNQLPTIPTRRESRS